VAPAFGMGPTCNSETDTSVVCAAAAAALRLCAGFARCVGAQHQAVFVQHTHKQLHSGNTSPPAACTTADGPLV
jgi:hypothetical protein